MEAIFATERISLLIPQIKQFVEEELIPLEKDHTTRPFKQTEKILATKRELVKAKGWWNLHLPKNEGGMGLTLYS